MALSGHSTWPYTRSSIAITPSSGTFNRITWGSILARSAASGGGKRTRTVIGSESIDRKLGRMTVTTRRERRERELRRRQREKRGGHPGGDGGGGGRGWLVGIGIVVLVVLALFALRQTGVLSTAQVSP